MAETKYISYGLNLLPLDKVMTALADRVDSYLDSQPFSNKVKNRWKELYMDVINNKGLLGASNQNGIWEISHGGDSTDNVSQRDKAIYGDIAYYILLTMSNIDSSTKKEEELKKAELEKFGSFDDNFKNYITKYKYRGRDWSNDWVNLDTRDSSTGLLNTTNRINELKKYLLQYKESLKDYDYEGSSFDNADDLKNSIDAAIQGLNNGDVNAISLVGLDPKEWLYNGAEDIAGTDAEGNQYTYSQLAQLNLQKAQQQAKAEEAKKQAIILNNRGIDLRVGGIHAVEARNSPEAYANWLARTYKVGQQGFNGINNRVQELIDKAYSSSLTNSDKKELGNLLFYIRKYNPNYNDGLNLSDEEWAELNKHNLTDKNRDNYIHLPWKTNGKDVYADGQGNLHILKNQNNAKLPTAFKKSLAAINYRNNFLKSENAKALNNTIGNNNGLTSDMVADLTAMGLDLVSAGSAFAPGYGTLASALTGIGATVSGAVADRMRGESWGSTLGTAGLGLSMDILGLIPGVGVGAKATKIAKIVAKGAKWLGPALGGLAAMSYGPGAISAYNKFTSGKKDDITAEELRDFTYAIRAIAAGGIRKAGTTYLGNRTLARAIKGEKTIGTTAKGPRASISSEKTSASITTENGLKINLTDDEFKTLKSNASRETKAKTITQAVLREKINMEGDKIEWRGINPIKGRFKTSSKSSKLSGLQEGTESNKIKWSSTSADYKGIRRFSNENLLRGFTTMSTPSSGIWRGIRNRWTGLDILNKSNQSTINPNTSLSESLKLLPLIKKNYDNSPKTQFKEGIPMSRALPQPGGIHKGNIVDNTRTGSLNSSKITLGDATKEFTDFHRMYIASGTKNSKVPSKAFGNGYGTSKVPEGGSLTFNGLTATVFKLDGDKGFSVTFGKAKDTLPIKTFKDIQLMRSYLASRLNKEIKKQGNVKETAALLRQFKAKGWLKQGGQINNNIDNIISEFLASKLI